ncbi:MULTISPECIES: sigma-70 family RNA polymerase sigma factor [unclassified Microbacterium]|uniref:sigma-70 family RNA polymerase sigma factor n=1 Tax=unclassified Microbacterium TaxID=2609290 RepID=UPI0012FCA3CD|nr:sigma-70 family RNA polymerase sigma factor [Microbacterium sp. MAH-37]MVQ40570.1 sigma-70 family RNA polymerase sigma factor [Microbacterium sp. MAH-37]
MSEQKDLAARFEEQRPRLIRLAERMLGSRADAEDAVQDAWLRVSRAGDDGVENFAGWLTTITSRICLTELRARSARGESSLDEGLPQPEVVPAGATPHDAAEMADALSSALDRVIDRLGPAERVAFVLHDSFDVPFEQVAEILDKTPDATRQIASRARRRLRAERPGSATDPHVLRRVVDAFFAAARAGDFDALVAVLDPGAVLRADSGASATTIVRGAAAVAGNALMFAMPDAVLIPVLVDGRAGVIVTVGGRAVSLMAFSVLDDRVVAIDAYAGPRRLAEIALPV